MKRKTKKDGNYCGIGGQAVLEGVMMRNRDKYAVAVRKPDGDIAVDVGTFTGPLKDSFLKKVPFIRGIFNFIESLMLGSKVLDYSTTFYEEDEEESKLYKGVNKITGGNAEKIISAFVMILSVALAVGLFIVLPYYVSAYLGRMLRNESLLLIIEGCIRIALFLLYAVAISCMKDIRRLYQYHGAEHKCINCIERGKPLTRKNVMRCSRFHKRCGTSFIFFVMLVSIVLFFFIKTDNVAQRVLYRILLMPVVAGISYEIIRIAGRSNHILVRILSAPGMFVQRLTTKEPDEEMVDVAIQSVEAIFDWKTYLREHFGVECNEEE